MTPASSVEPSTTRMRITLVVVTLVLAGGALLLAMLAERQLVGQSGPWLGPVQLKLAYNAGVAFSLGDSLPAWLITSVTAAITLTLGVYMWRVAPSSTGTMRLGFAAILAGALANLVDRALDGRVTDYLHTGWFPTFNLPDVYITCGAGSVLLGALWLAPRPREQGQ